MRLDDKNIAISDLFKIAYGDEKIKIREKDFYALKKCRRFVEKLIKEDKIMYGVNTGFGELARVKISKRDLNKLQKNIILSHSVGVGKRMEKEYIKAAVCLKIKTFLNGYSGVRKELVNAILKMINSGLIPVAYEIGSLGASGDLIPFAHIFATLYGEGKFYYKGKIIDAKKGLKIADIKDFKLEAKEGLALTNGMQFSAAIGGISLYKLKKIIGLYLKGAAFLFEIENANPSPFKMDVYNLRKFIGIKIVLTHLNKYLSKRKIDKKGVNVQDAYTTRCLPQVIGGIIDNLLYVEKEIEIELNSTSDNPLFIPKKELYLSTGNFHGESIAIALDSAAISASVLFSFMERQMNRIINPNISQFPPFLVENSGLNSGFMLVQYAMAALANRNTILATPASIHSLPVSGDQEDFVSMAGNSAMKFKESIENLKEGLSLFLISAAQASTFYKNRLSENGKKMRNFIFSSVKPYKNDRFFRSDIEKINKKIDEWILDDDKTIY